jgi:hypothetical protein
VFISHMNVQVLMVELMYCSCCDMVEKRCCGDRRTLTCETLVFLEFRFLGVEYIWLHGNLKVVGVILKRWLGVVLV